MKHADDEAKRCERPVRLVQVGGAQPERLMNVREMFEQMAQREGEMIREARDRAIKRSGVAQFGAAAPANSEGI